ncbi:hypothetical protein [Pseudomonas sp. BJa3]|uniref:hypothetical protein n=1 Tax=Pseudomonas sp. BJa3 TaxID=2986525 RepID=UPI002265ACDF|nr:hypothetical protein [Pseudomonas sp. BJa3]MCX5507683.1 hypothetical protein [Pseudomonas sp. BJa3]
MHMLITLMRCRGIELTKAERRAYRAVKGDVFVQCVQDAKMGRATNLAEVRPDLPMQPVPLPPLHDAKLSGMATLGFVLSGFEVIDGCAYAQSWWCRFE